MVVADSGISRAIALACAHPDSTQQGIIARAIDYEPKQISLRKVKGLIAAIIYQWCDFFEHRLNYIELRTVFDTLASDRGLGPEDLDLCDFKRIVCKNC